MRQAVLAYICGEGEGEGAGADEDKYEGKEGKGTLYNLHKEYSLIFNGHEKSNLSSTGF